MSLADVRQLCVSVLTASGTRSGIMDGLEKLVAEVQAVGLRGEAWVDGSFVTQKMNPLDADVVFMFGATAIGNPTPDQMQMLQNLATQGHFKASHSCDAYVVVFWPPGHPLHDLSVQLLEYWNRQWGFDRNKAPKGYAVVPI